MLQRRLERSNAGLTISIFRHLFSTSAPFHLQQCCGQSRCVKAMWGRLEPRSVCRPGHVVQRDGQMGHGSAHIPCSQPQTSVLVLAARVRVTYQWLQVLQCGPTQCRTYVMTSSVMATAADRPQGSVGFVGGRGFSLYTLTSPHDQWDGWGSTA